MSDKPTCAHCKEVLGNRYYQDVPKEGDLCLPCHQRWLNSIRVLCHQEAIREADGAGEMKTYTVIKRQAFSQFIDVEAPTMEEAVALVKAGGGEVVYEEYDYDLPVEEWEVNLDGQKVAIKGSLT